MATAIDRLGGTEQATRAQPFWFTSTQVGLSRPIVFSTVQYFIQIPPPPHNVRFFWVRRHGPIILPKDRNIFGQILRNSRICVKIWAYENFNRSKKTPWFSTKLSLESPPEVYRIGEPPIPIRLKKKQLLSVSSSRLKRKDKDRCKKHACGSFSCHSGFRPGSSENEPQACFLHWLGFCLHPTKNKDVFSAVFPFECSFSTHPGAIFYPNTPDDHVLLVIRI